MDLIMYLIMYLCFFNTGLAYVSYRRTSRQEKINKQCLDVFESFHERLTNLENKENE